MSEDKTQLQILARLAGWGYIVGGEGIEELVAAGLAERCRPDPNQYATLTAAGYKELAHLSIAEATREQTPDDCPHDAILASRCRKVCMDCGQSWPMREQ